MDWIPHLVSILSLISGVQSVGKSGHSQSWHTDNLSEFHIESEFPNLQAGLKVEMKWICFWFEVQTRDF